MIKTKTKKSRTKRDQSMVAYLFILPHLASVLLFLFVPLIYSLVISVYDFNMFKGFAGSVFVGLENYFQLFTDEKVWISLANNIKYMFGTIPITLALALLLAVLLNDKVFFKKTFRSIFFLPYIASAAAMAMVWMRIFSPTMGLINGWLKKLGLDNLPGWLASEEWAMPALFIIALWGSLGYNIVIYMGGLQGIDKGLYEASEIDGANFWQKLRYITIPMLSPTTFFLIITGVIGSFQVFGNINIMTQGGPGTSTHVIAYYTYSLAFRYYKMGYSSAVSWLLMALIMVVTLIQWKGQKKWVNY